MNNTALTKHRIYNQLVDFSEKDLKDIAVFIDYLKYKNKVGEKKIIKLEGILKNYDIDLSSLKEFKKSTWQHLDQEFEDE